MSRTLLILPLAALLATGGSQARKPPPLMDELVLNLADPVIEVRLGEQTLRLSVDLIGRDTLELNPDVFYRANLRYEGGAPVQVGPIEVAGVAAGGTIDVAGYPLKVTVSSHARPCCFGVDGTIGPDLLPYRTVRFVRGGAKATPPTDESPSATLPLRSDDVTGLHQRLETPQGRIFVQFGLANGFTLATYSAGARIAALGEGRLSGAAFTVAGPFGLPRQARLLRLDQPVTLGSFPFTSVPIRLDDYRGSRRFATEGADADDIVVEARRRRGELDWPSIVIGQDQLKRCRQIVFHRDPATLDLYCDPQSPKPVTTAATAPR